MATVTTSQTRTESPQRDTPPLQAGDRLTREEFERRYDAMPEVKKAELIDGVVYMPSPVTFDDHGSPHFDVVGWLAVYRSFTPGVRGGDNPSLRLDLKNMPQPDACLIIDPSWGGRVQLDPKGYIVGGPEFIGEISGSSASYDLHDKLNAYQRNGVQEYMVWRVYDRAVDWFVLRGDKYDRLAATPEGHYRSEVFPGLWLAANALIAGDLAAVFQTLQQGIATPEHRDFVKRLQAAKK